ncbi:MAG: hypothetical protein HY223_04265 [Thaumarchaeota archaeon]|nr:hypothetical protein [Nitrososphaerota archaeon]
MVDLSSGVARKALVSLAIEKALLEIGNAALEEVGNSLYSKYRCYFIDCLEHPEYLKDVLNQIFGLSHDSIIQSIEKNLGDLAHQKPITEFLVAISM